MRPCDAAYLAGLIDGDGYLSVRRTSERQKPKGEWQIFVRIIGASSPALHDLASSFGATISRRNVRRDRHREMWCMQWAQKKAAELVRELRPHFRLKARQADVLLTFADTYRVRYCRSRPITDEVRAERNRLCVMMRDLNRLFGRIPPSRL